MDIYPTFEWTWVYECTVRHKQCFQIFFYYHFYIHYYLSNKLFGHGSRELPFVLLWFIGTNSMIDGSFIISLGYVACGRILCENGGNSSVGPLHRVLILSMFPWSSSNVCPYLVWYCLLILFNLDASLPVDKYSTIHITFGGMFHWFQKDKSQQFLRLYSICVIYIDMIKIYYYKFHQNNAKKTEGIRDGISYLFVVIGDDFEWVVFWDSSSFVSTDKRSTIPYL